MDPTAPANSSTTAPASTTTTVIGPEPQRREYTGYLQDLPKGQWFIWNGRLCVRAFNSVVAVDGTTSIWPTPLPKVTVTLVSKVDIRWEF